MTQKARPFSEASTRQIQREYKRWAHRLEMHSKEADLATRWIAMLNYECECRRIEAEQKASSAISGAASAVRKEQSVLHSVLHGVKK
jgi:hypothetical protein